MKTKLLTSFIGALIVLVFPLEAFAANLSLSPVSGTFNKGCSFSLKINLDTSGVQTDGTDAIIQYDQSKVSATSITSGSIYPDYPGNSIADELGKATISGLASVSSPFSGSGTLATINFTVKDTANPGATIIKFQFDANDKSNTTDSNVVERGTVADVLSSVTNGAYTVGSGSACATGNSVNTGNQGSTGIATPSATTTPTNIDQIVGQPPGTAELTFTIAIVGSVLTILGILGLVLL